MLGGCLPRWLLGVTASLGLAVGVVAEETRGVLPIQRPAGRGAYAPVVPNAPAHNAGLFVGVNEFRVDKVIAPLRFAVDDAIAQAHLFVIDLKLIAPDNAFIALSGAPSTETAATQLAELSKTGVLRVDAVKSSVLMS